MAKLPNWTEKEVQILQENTDKTNKELVPIFAANGFAYRTTTSIEQKRRKLGLDRPSDEWTSEEIQILLDNYETLEDKQISDLLLPHKSHKAINLKRFNLGLMKNSKWTPQDDTVLRENYHKGVEFCFSLLPHHPIESIYTHANDLGLRVDVSELKRIYDFNRKYFTELTLENCYWAGFIAADGCVQDNGTLSIGLAVKDKEHLQKFADAIGYTGSLREYWYAREDIKDIHKVQLELTTAKQIASDLQKWFNITPRKTKTLEAPTLLTPEQQVAFVAGYTDGDGSIFIAKKDNSLHYSVVGGLSSMSFIKGVFDVIVPIPESGRGRGCLMQIDKDRYTFPMYRYIVTGSRAVAILQKIKQYPLPLLERKWGKVPPC
ncbi:MAG: hypothetical protein IM613_12710 [Cytophagales bacterium]|nr:hypothetical protein [Cytophagales bacterium]